MNGRVIAVGAEAILVRSGRSVIKRRLRKGYRFGELDERLRKRRTRREGKLLEKAGKFISCPKVIKVSENTYEVEIEFIEGKRLSESLEELWNKYEVCRQIGENIGKLHENGIIHGDLTTSNMILKKERGRKNLYFIDFGLGFHSDRIEDKAVDLHLIKGALEARHSSVYSRAFGRVLEGYKKGNKDWRKVFKRLEKVEKRGRYKN